MQVVAPQDDTICRRMNDLHEVFSADGPLARHIPGYKSRQQQIEMAQAIAETIENHGVLVAEAGTGTGKTFAYLVPALRSGGKVIVSTGTKTLQDQLFDRDLPVVRKALQASVTAALLKGRANYVCHYHLERAKNDGRFASRSDVGYLGLIASYARTSSSGDKSGCGEVPEVAAIWSQVTSTRENCLGSDCPDFKDCFVMKARKHALEADVVVVNHHLFFADVVLRDEGVSELLPACNTVILDEAHQLAETASLFFGETTSTAQLLELARDARLEGAAAAKDFAALPESAQALEKAAKDLRLAWEGESGRAPAQAALSRKGFVTALDAVVNKLESLNGLLEFQADRSEGLARCWERSCDQLARLKRWHAEPDPDYVRWIEVFAHSLQLHATPLSVGEIFARQLTGTPRAWIFTSATLSVKGDFSHYARQLGLDRAQMRSWDSPFDYPHQALLYVPEGMPDPNDPAYTQAVVNAVLPAIVASGGRAFCLFTSLRAMREAREKIEDGLRKRGLDFPVLLQGEGSRTDLLERFRQLGNAVLVGSQSFWEGVDVRGPTLSLVMIDRLPFTPPDDPVLTARIERINAQGGNAFMDHQLPQAVILLKQGAGRLIRDETDRGVLMICDPRIITKSYGKRVWQSLPPMRRTRDIRDVEAFFEAEGVQVAAPLSQPSPAVAGEGM
jgi:ATP-dependent DNA helicase DinG